MENESNFTKSWRNKKPTKKKAVEEEEKKLKKENETAPKKQVAPFVKWSYIPGL